MTHFSCLVVAEDVESALAPFHEFECTGRDDAHVVELDVTETYRRAYETETARMMRGPAGELVDPEDPRFYRDLTAEERCGPESAIAPDAVVRMRDWGDGRGPRARVRFVPEGWQRISVPLAEALSFAAYVQTYHGRPLLAPGVEPDLSHGCGCKYGYARLSATGEVERVVERTNPNARWDYWLVGGRYAGRLVARSGARVDALRKAAIDWDATRPLGRSFALTYALLVAGRWLDQEGTSDAAWAAVYWPLVDALPADALLTVVDCHV